MPSYRGVAQAEILSSLSDTLALLERHPIGPECQKGIDRLRTPDPATGLSPLDAIAGAADDAELVLAARMAQTTSLLTYIAPVLYFHAGNDTDGQGRDIISRLGAWAQIGGARAMVYKPIDAECDAYLACRYARIAAQKFRPFNLAGAFALAASEMGARGLVAAGLFSGLVASAKIGATDAKLTKYFLSLDIGIRHDLVALGAFAAGLDHNRNPPLLGPMNIYTLVIDDLAAGGRIKWTDPAVDVLRRNLENVLAPFGTLDETGMTGINSKGLLFESTPRVAQAVAGAFPGMQVLDGGLDLPPFAGKKRRPAPKP